MFLYYRFFLCLYDDFFALLQHGFDKGINTVINFLFWLVLAQGSKPMIRRIGPRSKTAVFDRSGRDGVAALIVWGERGDCGRVIIDVF